MRSLLDIIYESISDSDSGVNDRTSRDLFYHNFAESFVKVFGKINRNNSKRALNVGKIGEIVVSSTYSDEWHFNNSRQNGFISKLDKLFELLKKKYPDTYYDIEYDTNHILHNLNMTNYTIKVYRDRREKMLFQWKIILIRESEKIKRISIYSITESNPKSTDKELLKIIDDNI